MQKGVRAPFLHIPAPPMSLFSPEEQETALEKNAAQKNVTVAPAAFSGLADVPLSLFTAARSSKSALVPREADCHALWDKYAMPAHIRRHSILVAGFAAALARQANSLGRVVLPEAAFAAGLLHDIGKFYCITHGGNHAQLGASWVMRETRNGPIARAVLFHVHWPWSDELAACIEHDDFFLAMAVLYADKRVKHDVYTSIDERYADLQNRYGCTDHARLHIEQSRMQGKQVEILLSQNLGVALDEYIADNGRLVKRT